VLNITKKFSHSQCVCARPETFPSLCFNSNLLKLLHLPSDTNSNCVHLVLLIKYSGIMTVLTNLNNSFRSLSHDRSTASTTASSPNSAILLPFSNPRNLSSPQGHLVVAYFFFFVRPSLLSFPLSFYQ
jgi:hypothetical protein